MKTGTNDSIYKTVEELIRKNAQNEQYLWGVIESRNRIAYELMTIVEEMATHSSDPEQFEKFEKLLDVIKKRMDAPL